MPATIATVGSPAGFTSVSMPPASAATASSAIATGRSAPSSESTSGRALAAPSPNWIRTGR